MGFTGTGSVGIKYNQGFVCTYEKDLIIQIVFKKKERESCREDSPYVGTYQYRNVSDLYFFYK